MHELGFQLTDNVLYLDNEAMNNFINGQGDAKAVRDVETRMYYARETIHRNIFRSAFVPSGDNHADYMTKPATGTQLIHFRNHVQGLILLNTSN
jgi:hypothetical protein